MLNFWLIWSFNACYSSLMSSSLCCDEFLELSLRRRGLKSQLVGDMLVLGIVLVR